MRFRILLAALSVLYLSTFTLGQSAPRPPKGPPPAPGMRPSAQRAPAHPNDWLKRLDANNNGSLDLDELRSATEFSFNRFDQNGNGLIEPGEIAPRPGSGNPRGSGFGKRPGEGPRPDNTPGDKMLPPFFFRDRDLRERNINRSEFDEIVQQVFDELDKDGDRQISGDEALAMPPPPPKGMGPEGPPFGPQAPPPPPNARFIGAELRFGDKLVTGQPFSAETIVENTRRLFDGTTVTKQDRGAIYRDNRGRTRREQPIALVGGLGLVDKDNEPQKLVYISDLANGQQIFLDVKNKTAQKSLIGPRPRNSGPDEPVNAKTESLGTKVIEGITVEGTLITTEIPAGQFGGQGPIRVTTERWFSPDLQVVVYSRHVDPFAGEHIFKLINIVRSEPDQGLFAVPADYRMDESPVARPARP